MDIIPPETKYAGISGNITYWWWCPECQTSHFTPWCPYGAMTLGDEKSGYVDFSDDIEFCIHCGQLIKKEV